MKRISLFVALATTTVFSAPADSFVKVIPAGNAEANETVRAPVDSDDMPLLERIPPGKRFPLVADGEMKFTVEKRKRSSHEYLENKDLAGIPLNRPWTVKTLLEKLGDIKGVKYRVYGDATVPSDPDAKISNLRSLADYMRKFGYSVKWKEGNEVTKVFVTEEKSDER